MNENKKIEILGQHNRYNIKKANKEKKIKNKLNDSLKILLNKKNLQIEHLNTLYMVDSINLNVLQKNILREIEKKRNSYKNQDIKYIKKQAKKLNAKIITTEKDYIKLSKIHQENINFVKVKINFRERNNFIKFLKLKINEKN